VQIEETGFDNYQRERHLLSQARRHLIDGLIMSPVLRTSVALQPTPITPPMVFLGEVRQNTTDHVWVDNVAASRDMVEHLIGLGHRRIAMLGRFESESARLRRKGYRQALTAAGLAPSAGLEISNPTWTTAAAAALEEYLERRRLPDAIFCLTDSQALGALNTLWRRGIRVPEDVSVAGYDDITDGRYAVPPLTTVGIDKARLAEAAIDLLIERIAEPRRRPRRVTIPYTILPRESSRPAPR
jgi:DNA-binding LacI/PurR family transcriptional regulator